MFAKTGAAAAALNECFRTRQTDKHYLCVVNGEVVVEGVDRLVVGSERGGEKGCNVYRHMIQKTQAERVRCYDIVEAGSSAGGVGGGKGKGGKGADESVKKRRTDDLVEAVLRCYPLVVISPFSPFKPIVTGTSTTSSSGSSSGKPTPITVDSIPPQPSTIKQTICRIELETGRKHQIRAQMAHIGHPIVGDVKYGAPQAFKQRDIALHACMLTITHPVTGKEMTFTAPPPALWSKRFGEGSLAAAIDEMNKY